MTVTTYAPPKIQPDWARRQTVLGRVSDAAMWRLERQLLGQEFTDLTMRILLAGGESGVDMLPPGFDVVFDWDVFNQEALNWMRTYLTADPGRAGELGQGVYGWVSQLTESTKQSFMREVDDWVREGAALPVLERRLEPIFGSQRAKRIAATEVTRIYAAGNETAWTASGMVTGKRWMTARDERVCPICGPLHATIVDINTNWDFTPEMLAAYPDVAKALREGTTIRRPPAHVNCRCYLQPVLYELEDDTDLERWSFQNAQQGYVKQEKKSATDLKTVKF